MKKFVLILVLLLLLNNAFAAFGIDQAQPQTQNMVRISFEYCISSKVMDKESCFMYAQPTRLSDCNLITSDLNNYEKILSSCYFALAYYDQTACEVMPFSDANKQACFIQARICDKINSIESKDACYQYKYECDKISSSEAKSSCTSALNQKNLNNLISGIIGLLVLLAFIFSPIILFWVVAKTIIELIKKKPISTRSWIIRLIVIFVLIPIWLLVSIILLVGIY